MEKHIDFVRRAVVRLGGSRLGVEDLVQDVFLVAVRTAPEFEGRSAKSTWLYGIAAKVLATARRRARVRHVLGLEGLPEPVDRRSPAVLVENRESRVALYSLLDKISEK